MRSKANALSVALFAVAYLCQTSKALPTPPDLSSASLHRGRSWTAPVAPTSLAASHDQSPHTYSTAPPTLQGGRPAISFRTPGRVPMPLLRPREADKLHGEPDESLEDGSKCSEESMHDCHIGHELEVQKERGIELPPTDHQGDSDLAGL